jgi:hypothetical protein
MINDLIVAAFGYAARDIPFSVLRNVAARAQRMIRRKEVALARRAAK